MIPHISIEAALLAMMSDTQFTVIVAAVPPTLLALASLITSIRNSNKIARVEEHTNGMSKQLLQAAFIAGVKSETDKTESKGPEGAGKQLET